MADVLTSALDLSHGFNAHFNMDISEFAEYTSGRLFCFDAISLEWAIGHEE